MDYGLYIKDIFESFVAPGLLGGLLIGFSSYILSLGFAKAFELINTFGNYEVYEND